MICSDCKHYTGTGQCGEYPTAVRTLREGLHKKAVRENKCEYKELENGKSKRRKIN